jgi:hypothetical protein
MNAKNLPPVPKAPQAINRSDMSPEDVNLLQEIDDSLRAEKLAKLWKNFGGAIVAACAAILLSTIGWVVWNNHVSVKKAEATGLLVQAAKLETEGKFSDAADIYAKVPDMMPSLAALARIRQADALLGAGQNEKALAVLQSVTGKPDGWTELAKLKAQRLQQEKAGAAIQVTQNAVYPFTAQEWTAVEQIRVGDGAKAKETLSQLQMNPDAPQTIKTRAGALLVYLQSRPVNNEAPAKP